MLALDLSGMSGIDQLILEIWECKVLTLKPAATALKCHKELCEQGLCEQGELFHVSELFYV